MNPNIFLVATAVEPDIVGVMIHITSCIPKINDSRGLGCIIAHAFHRALLLEAHSCQCWNFKKSI
jgi:hypothetical protein